MGNLGENIFVLRVRDRLTIEELSKRSKISKSSIGGIETKGRASWKTHVEMLAQVFGVESRQLILGQFSLEDALKQNENCLGNYLEALCIARKISKTELSRISGVSRMTISKVINNGYIPTNDVVLKLAEALDFSPDKFTKQVYSKEEIENMRDNIKVLCQLTGRHVSSVSRETGISRSTIIRILTPEDDYTPQNRYLEKIAQIFGKTVDELTRGKIYATNPMERLTQNICYLCELRCLEDCELEKRAGLKEHTINDMLKQRRKITRSRIKKIAEALNVTEEELLNNDYSIETMSISREHVGSNVIKLCEEYGFTYQELAQKTGLTCMTIMNIVKQRSLPSKKTIRKIAEVFEIEPQSLMKLPQ